MAYQPLTPGVRPLTPTIGSVPKGTGGGYQSLLGIKAKPFTPGQYNQQNINLNQFNDPVSLHSAFKSGQINKQQFQTRLFQIQSPKAGNSNLSLGKAITQTAAGVPATVFNLAKNTARSTSQAAALTGQGVVNLERMGLSKIPGYGKYVPVQKETPVLQKITGTGPNPSLHQYIGAALQTAALGIPAGKFVEEGVKASEPTLAAVLRRAATTGAKQVPTGATFGAGAGIEAGQKPKQILKSAGEGAAAGVALGAGGSTLAQAINRAKAVREVLPNPPKSAFDNHIVESPTLSGGKSTVKAPAKGVTPVEGATATVGKGTAQIAPKAPNESGMVAPGQIVKDTQAMIDKHQKVTNATGNIAEDYAKTQGRATDIKLDVAKVLKNRQPLSVEDKQTLQDFRDAKAAGLTPAPLPEHLQQADANITALNKSAQAADAEKARLTGNEAKAQAIESRNPETYTHRIAQDKGSKLELTVRGDTENPLSVGSLSKTTAGSKKQVYMNATDEAGNRNVVAVKQGKVTAFENGQSRDLGNLNLKKNEDFLSKELQPYQSKVNNLEKEGKALANVKTSGGVSDARITKLAQKAALLEDPGNMTTLTKSEAKSLRDAKLKLKELTNVKSTKTSAEGRLKTINLHLMKMNNEIAKIHDKYNPETLDQKAFKGADGKKYTLGQATQSEITKHTGQKYYVDPELTSHLNYADSKVSLENTRFTEGTKKILEDKGIAVKDGETAPKGYQRTSSPYFAGYKLQPKVAEALDDITAGKKSAGGKMLGATSRFLRNTIIWVPVKHDFNMGAGYIVDRGLTSWLNPVAYGRMGKSLVAATKEVATQGPLYRQMLKEGSPLVTADDKVLGKVVQKQVKDMLGNKDKVANFAKAFGMSPVRGYQALQKVTVWDVQDILNIARVHERMQGTMFGGKMSFDEALKQTQKYNFQYKVPSRVAGSRVASELLQGKTPLTYFGHYTYDKFRIAKNVLKDTGNLSNPKQAFQAADKLAAAVAISAVIWPQVDKELQHITGDKNAHITAPGVTSLPEAIQQVKEGKKSIAAASGSQISVSLPVNVATQLHDNVDSFTGKRIWDVNATDSQKAAAIGTWLKTQLPPAQKLSSGKNATTNKALSTALSLAGVSTPKNSPTASKLQSLQYDSLPGVQTQARTQGKANNIAGALKTIQDYDNKVLAAAKADLKAQGKPIPDDQTLIKQLKKSKIYYQPKQSTVQNWSKPKKAVGGGFSL